MQCPDCGYMMSAFDKDCARCKGLGLQARPALPPAPQQPPEPPEAPPAFTPAPNVPAASPASVIPGGALACPVCGNQATQKVTAICEGGTWTTNSRSHTTMIGSDGAGHLMMMGGPTSTSSLSQTGLASRLMPPVRPRAQQFSVGLGILAALLGIGGAFAVVNAVQDAWNVSVLIFGLIAAAIGIRIFYPEVIRATRDHEIEVSLIPAWERARVIWNRAFYCGRCDHAYDPQSGQYVPAGDLRGLYPPITANKALISGPVNYGKEIAVGYGIVAALLLGIALFMNAPTASPKAVPAAVVVVPAPVAAAPLPAPVTMAPPAITMRTKAGGGSESDVSAAQSNVNLPPVTLQVPAPSNAGTAN